MASTVHRPEDWPRRFEESLNAGDLEGVLALYEPEARFVDESGHTTEVHYEAIEVVRAQPDGQWNLIVGDPNARG